MEFICLIIVILLLPFLIPITKKVNGPSYSERTRQIIEEEKKRKYWDEDDIE